MKVIGGCLKGRNLSFKKTGVLRPTKNVAREALFDIAGNRLDDKRVLDLFAGTGALGIESISRGASLAVFVEMSPELMALIKKNIRDLGINDKAEFINASVESAVRRFARECRTFDLVIADPPYDYDEVRLRKIFRGLSTIVNQDGTAVLELSSRTVFSEEFEGWDLTKERKYGSTKLQFYKKKGKAGGLPGQF